MRFWLFLLGLTIFTNNAISQLKASFTANTTNACMPLIVKFTDTSLGNPSQWKWDLGNGIVSTEQNPSTIYFNPGTYTVKLVVSNAAGKDSLVKTNYITVYKNPVVDFTANPTSGCSPLAVQFTDGSAAGSGTLAQWSWDFGDGFTDSVQNPIHIYTVGNNFGVVLTVKNNFGCKQTLEKSGFINASAPVKAVFSYNYTNACQPPATVTFTNSSSPVSLSYQWIFGDGSTSSQTSPVYTYDSAGDYQIKLIATNDKGCTDTAASTISIGTVRPDFTYNSSCVNQTITFTNTSTPAPLSVLWSFGDNTTDTKVNTTHLYTTAGTYQVTMTADFGSCQVSKKKLITVSNIPSPAFTVSGSVAQCALPATVLFNNTTNGAASYQWLFGDSTISTEINPNHTYTQAGSFDVTLIAIAPGGCSDTLTQKKLINLGPPKITGIQNLPLSGCVGDNIKMTPAILSPEAITSYSWDFGDSFTSTDPIPVHTYTTAGIYTVKLTVVTTGGCTTSFTDSAIITAIPVAKFSSAPSDVCASVPVLFTDQSTGSITGWVWNFGDGTTSNVQNPSHNFADTGKMVVTLTVSNLGCKNTYQGDTVIIHPPIANFGVYNQCLFQFIKVFTDSSIGAVSRVWNFGDGQTSTSLNPQHTYAATGNYQVSLTVTNGSCSYTNTQTVPVVKQNPSFTYTPAIQVFCKYSKIQFQVTNYDPSVISSFYWDFGDKATSPFSTLGCKDTVSGAVAFTVYGPTAAFAPTVTGTCLKATVQFTDNSTTDGIHNIVKWVWNYGDGENDTLSGPPFQHTYNVADTFTIGLKVVDSYGCSDSLSRQKILVITQPHADFSLSDSLRCANNNITFNNLSTGNLYSSAWDFGDGSTASVQSPVHPYANQGLYTVKLTVTDQFGCTDSIIKQNILSISNPVASFSLADTFATCPPLFIQPQNTSRNYQTGSVSWQFGDGNTSSLINPLHNYINGGNYQLSLIVGGYGQCYDTTSKMVVLHGPSGILSYPHFAGCEPATITVSAVIKNSQYRTWDFGDGVVVTDTNSSETHTYTAYGLYQPKLLLTDTSGCLLTVLNPDTVHVSGISAGISSVQQTSCDSSLINFTDSSRVYYDTLSSYSWNFGDNSPASDSPDPGHYYLHSGNYIISHSVQSQLGCKDTVTTSLVIAVYKSPAIIIHTVDSACMLTSVQFGAQDTAAGSSAITSWQWDFGDGGTAAIQQPLYAFPGSGSFQVQVAATNADGCTSTASGGITILPLPLTDAGPDTTLCLGQSLTLNPTGAANYVWNSQPSLSCDHCNNPVASPDFTTRYYVTGSNLGCQATDSILVQVKRPFTLTVSPSDTLCAGGSIQLHSTGGEVYQWQPTTRLSDPAIANPVASPAATTTYTLVATDDKQCFSDTGQLTVSVFPRPVLTIIDSSITVMTGYPDSIRTTGSTDIVRWEWIPATWLTCNDCPEPVTQPTNNIVYTAIVYNQAGCTASGQVTVRVLCSDANVYIPNTFSPNNNNMNERFYPRGRGLFGISSFKIFDRNGTIVFDKRVVTPNNAADGWDGTYKGRPAPTGVYVYIMEVTCGNNTVLNLKGNITLIR
jgi:gliding motility-associated-like protein